MLLSVKDEAGYARCITIAEQLASPESPWCGNHVSETFIESKE